MNSYLQRSSLYSFFYHRQNCNSVVDLIYITGMW